MILRRIVFFLFLPAFAGSLDKVVPAVNEIHFWQYDQGTILLFSRSASSPMR